MIPGLFDDRASRALRTALSGLQLRQQTIANNIANVDTPLYKATEVKFEDQLLAELTAPPNPRLQRIGLDRTHERHIPVEPQISRTTTQLTVTPSPDGTLRADGNTVDVEREMAKLAETQLLYTALGQVQTRKFQHLREAIREGR